MRKKKYRQKRRELLNKNKRKTKNK